LELCSSLVYTLFSQCALFYFSSQMEQTQHTVIPPMGPKNSLVRKKFRNQF
jgi:hypothetical protein